MEGIINPHLKYSGGDCYLPKRTKRRHSQVSRSVRNSNLSIFPPVRHVSVTYKSDQTIIV